MLTESLRYGIFRALRLLFQIIALLLKFIILSSMTILVIIAYHA